MAGVYLSAAGGPRAGLSEGLLLEMWILCATPIFNPVLRRARAADSLSAAPRIRRGLGDRAPNEAHQLCVFDRRCDLSPMPSDCFVTDIPDRAPGGCQ